MFVVKYQHQTHVLEAFTLGSRMEIGVETTSCRKTQFVVFVVSKILPATVVLVFSSVELDVNVDVQLSSGRLGVACVFPFDEEKISTM